ncbi:bromodomain and WD repeat-containing protein 1-like isoform X3 [Apostichopus japonicus]|uniref:bromodomain and WD repeat-containing protein 1-like isoform X3 n=1 Tax=Stichopus japonicus TaxID=307972 RepID=UPI003AB130F4
MGKLQKKEELRKTPCSKKLVQPLDRINSSKKSLTKERLVTLEGTGDVKVWVKGCNQLIEVMEKLLEDSTPLRQQSVNTENSGEFSERMLRKKNKLSKLQHSYGTRSQDASDNPINGEGDEMVDEERLEESSGYEVKISDNNEEGGSSDYSDCIEEKGKAQTKRKYKRKRARKKNPERSQDPRRTPRKKPRRTLKRKTEELMKVVGVKYHIGPPTTCGLKLTFIDSNTRKQTGGFFQLRYHAMSDVIDFLVLAQHYDIAMKRKLKPGDRFRAVIDDQWWLGVIENKVPLEAENPGSLFQCFHVRWDNGEAERMSPWDLEPIDKKNEPCKVRSGDPLTPAEIQQLRYKPQVGEWGERKQGEECDRILKCLDQVMSLRIAKMFNAPVDLSKYPDYAMTVPYPTDLTTIRNRLMLRFYRRRSALQWEVRRIEWNTNAYNDPNRQIVKNSKLVTNILLEVIRDLELENAISLYNQMIGNTEHGDKMEESSGSKSDDESSSEDDDTDSSNKPPAKKRRSMRTYDDKAWIEECRRLLDIMFASQDSTPFRQPVDKSVYPNYRNVIDHPMDLSTVREQLNSRLYEDPIEFAKDVRLIFTNSKAFNTMDLWTVREQLNARFYQDPIEFAKNVRLIFTNSKAFNTNKKSEIYSMTLRLSALFEDKVRDTLRDYKNAAKHIILTKGKRRPSWFQRPLNSEQSSQSDILPELDDKPGPSGISTRTTRSRLKQVTNGVSQVSQQSDDSGRSDSDTIPLTKDSSSGDDDEDLDRDSSSEGDEEDGGRGEKTPTKQISRRRCRRTKRMATAGKRRIQSKGSKRKTSHHSQVEEEDEPNDSPSMRTRNRGKRTVVYDENDSEEGGEEMSPRETVQKKKKRKRERKVKKKMW